MSERAVHKKFVNFITNLAAVITLVGFVMGIYQYIKSGKPELEVNIVSNTGIYNTNEIAKGLEIFYQGKNIQKDSHTVSLIVLKVENVGHSSILPKYYDESYPLSLHFTNGDVLGFDFLQGSSDYLEQIGREQLKSNGNSITLPTVILDSNESYRFKVMVFHSSKVPLEFSLEGKVASTQIHLTNQVERENFIKKLFGGSWDVQIHRAIFYTSATISLMFSVGFILGAISHKLKVYKRRQFVKKYKEFYEGVPSEDEEIVFDYYIEYEIFEIDSWVYSIETESFFEGELLKWDLETFHSELGHQTQKWVCEFEKFEKIGLFGGLDKRLTCNVLEQVNDKYHLCPSFKDFLKEFVNFIKIKSQ